MNALLILIGKLFSLASKAVNLGSGSTWPGHIALSINKNFIKEVLKENPHLKIILIAGTNGKTTTGKLIQTILKKTHYRVFQNESGANLLNGIVSSMLLHSSILCKIKYDYAIFEVDENTLPLALKEITADYLILINLFRDQLDRYGEVNTIANKWQKVLEGVSTKTSLILNADDPQIAYIGVQSNPPGRWIRSGTSVFYFGLNDKTLHQASHQHAVDSTYCPNCNSKLYYNTTYYSHLGDWKCEECNNQRPKLDAEDAPSFPLAGIYNRYNTIAAVLLSRELNIQEKYIYSALREFKPAFGRQEMLNVNGKKIQIFLSKNPTSFNESLRTITSLNAKNMLLVLNDRIPDGRDISWIWDVDFEDYVDSFNSIFISGDRAYDMGIRIKYASKFSVFNPSTSLRLRGSDSRSSGQVFQFSINESLKEAINLALEKTKKSDTLYVLPTYSAMLKVRKMLIGKKIL